MTKATPDPCGCGSRMFTRVYGLRQREDHSIDETNDLVRAEGWKCEECGATQLTKEIPKVHAEEDELGLPESAERDMVRED